MKKFLQRVLGMVVAIIGFTYNLCYADLIDPNHPSLPRGEGNIVPMIIIGVVAFIFTIIGIKLGKKIGDYLGLPKELVHKTPIDGLNIKEDGSYVTDEDNLGVTYAEIDSYLGVNPTMINKITWIKVDDLVYKSAFKRKPIPTFKV